MPDGATPDSAETDQLPTSQTVRLGVLLALVGGGLDAYTFVSRGGVFANAQTGNVVLMSVAAAQAHWRQALNHVPAIIAFVAGVITAESLKRPKVATLVRKPARAAIVLEIVVLLLVGFVPHNTLNSLVIILVAFTASVQVSTFRTLVDTPYATTMTTGNLRTAAQSAHRALADHDAEAARRTRQFGTIILASSSVPSAAPDSPRPRAPTPCGSAPPFCCSAWCCLFTTSAWPPARPPSRRSRKPASVAPAAMDLRQEPPPR